MIHQKGFSLFLTLTMNQQESTLDRRTKYGFAFGKQQRVALLDFGIFTIWVYPFQTGHILNDMASPVITTCQMFCRPSIFVSFFALSDLVHLLSAFLQNVLPKQSVLVCGHR